MMRASVLLTAILISTVFPGTAHAVFDIEELLIFSAEETRELLKMCAQEKVNAGQSICREVLAKAGAKQVAMSWKEAGPLAMMCLKEPVNAKYVPCRDRIIPAYQKYVERAQKQGAKK